MAFNAERLNYLIVESGITLRSDFVVLTRDDLARFAAAVASNERMLCSQRLGQAIDEALQRKPVAR